MLADLPTAPWFRRVLVAGLLLGLLLLTFSVLQPFIVPLIWGGILAYVCWPLHQRMVRGCGGRAGIAALATTLLATIAIVGPLLWLILMVRVEALNAYQTVLAFLKSDPELAPELRELPGVGPFSAGLILIRGAGAPDAFPGDEPRLFAILREAYGLPEDAPPAAYRKLADAWRPYRSWASFLFRASVYGSTPQE